MFTKRSLEICVDNHKGAVAAAESDADRLELCRNLFMDGLTPSQELFLSVKEEISIPVFVMIRSRPGNFVYSKTEIDEMVQTALAFRSLGADGFVFGALKNDGEIDKEACEKILRAADEIPVTFHRAFDTITRKEQNLETLIELGFKRVLTSGLENKSAYEGRSILKSLVKQADKRIIVMPGGGITDYNMLDIMKDTSALEYHSSGRQNFHTNVDTPIIMSEAMKIPKSSEVNRIAVKNMKKILTKSC